MAIEIKTLYKGRQPKEIKDKIDKIIFALLRTCESIINIFVPFLAGFYLGKTNRLFWIFPFIILIVINLRIDYKNGYFHIEILNNFWR